jgi:subtilisin family serine protease
MTKRRIGVLTVALAMAVGLLPVAGASAELARGAPVNAGTDRPIPDSYIVVVKDGADARSVAAISGVSPRFVYTAALNGFSATLNRGQLTALQNNPNVAYIEQNQAVTVTQSVTQTGATWGLDRIDQKNRPLNSTFNYNATGAGVTAYIIDTGIFFAHADFGGRASTGVDLIDGGTADDCHSHGTHVAGTVGGTTYGVAKAVNLVAVRVFDCSGSGSWDTIIAGIDWVIANHAAKAVANMSLGGGASAAVDTAVGNLINAGVTAVVAAGNGNWLGIAQDACKYSPARVPAAITVGATDSSDRKASFSNYGSCVDLFAPGVSITSDSNTTGTTVKSGTSMAAPHVAGVAALYLQGAATTTGPDAVRQALWSNATQSMVTQSRTTAPRLLFTNY